MAKSNAINVKVFPEWFDIDLDSFEREIMLCNKLFKLIEEDEWEWGSDKTGFWVEERKGYYRHNCQDGKVINFPIPIKEDIEPYFQIKSVNAVPVGKVVGAAAKSFSEGAIPKHLIKQAREDVRNNPIHEQGMDWEALRETL